MQCTPIHLVAHTLCPYVQRSVIVLLEKGIVHSRTDIDLLNKPDWFTQKSPLGKVPILIVNQEQVLFESAVICEYLDEVTADSLHPADKLQKAYHRAWIEFGSSILNAIASMYNANDAAHFFEIHSEIKAKWRCIEKELQAAPFFTGETFYLIDAVYGPIFRYFDVFDTFCDLSTFDKLPKCQLWRNALRSRESVKQAVANDYSDALIQFLINRRSYMSQLIAIKR